MKKVLITGSSSGFGYALCKKFANLDWITIGISKSDSENVSKNIVVDFKDPETLKNKLIENKSHLEDIDLVILNAGQLGRIDHADKITLSELKEIIAINLFSNKLIIDFLACQKKTIHFIAISSGASLTPYSGWLQYCISKSALNQLIACYGNEANNHFFLSVAPGLIKTKMQKKILKKDKNEFPDLKKFDELFDSMDTAEEKAEMFVGSLQKLLLSKNGSYVDLRQLNEKETI